MIGQLASCLAGRDKDRVLLIVEILDGDYVAIADGQTRKIEKPKRKKLKHLRILDLPKVEIPKTNKELREMIKSISQS